MIYNNILAFFRFYVITHLGQIPTSKLLPGDIIFFHESGILKVYVFVNTPRGDNLELFGVPDLDLDNLNTSTLAGLSRCSFNSARFDRQTSDTFRLDANIAISILTQLLFWSQKRPPFDLEREFPTTDKQTNEFCISQVIKFAARRMREPTQPRLDSRGKGLTMVHALTISMQIYFIRDFVKPATSGDKWPTNQQDITNESCSSLEYLQQCSPDELVTRIPANLQFNPKTMSAQAFRHVLAESTNIIQLEQNPVT